MQSKSSVLNGPRSRRRDRRSRTRDRPIPRREPRSFEALEGRFLLSGLTSSTTVPALKASPLLPLPTNVLNQIPIGPRLTSPSTGLVRDDSYTLDATKDEPAVRVDLVWPIGPNPSAGDLLVFDTSGRVLYDVPLLGITDLNAKLSIPGASDIDVDLQITNPGTNPASTGSYQVTIRRIWSDPAPKFPGSTTSGSVSNGPASTSGPLVKPAPPATLAPSTTPGLDYTPGSPAQIQLPAMNASPTPDQSGITSTKGLPAAFPISGSSPTISVGPPATVATVTPIVTPADPSAPRVGSLAPGPATPSTLTTAPLATPSSLGSPTLELPLPASQGAGSGATIGDGNRPAVVGPLPLIGASPDGGIFAYPYSQSKGAVDPFRPTFTFATAIDLLDAPEPQATHRAASSRVTIPLDLPEGLLTFARPCDLEMAGSPGVTGSAFLPPMAPVAMARLDRPSDRDGGSRWPILYSKIKPKTSLAALLFGSAGLFFGLVAPDCVTRLAVWKKDRRLKHLVRFVVPKKPERDLGELA